MPLNSEQALESSRVLSETQHSSGQRWSLDTCTKWVSRCSPYFKALLWEVLSQSWAPDTWLELILETTLPSTKECNAGWENAGQEGERLPAHSPWPSCPCRPCSSLLLAVWFRIAASTVRSSNHPWKTKHQPVVKRCTDFYWGSLSSPNPRRAKGLQKKAGRMVWVRVLYPSWLGGTDSAWALIR